MPPSITSIGSTWVEPAAPIKPEVVKMSTVDNLCAQVYPVLMYFYRLKDDVDALIYHDRLRRGLSRTLYEQPILTGTLQQNERGAFSVAIPPASKAGCLLHYRDLSNDDTFPSLQQLAANNYPMFDGDMDGMSKLVFDDFPASSDGDPVFIASLTHIKGGLIMYAAVSHCIADIIQPRATTHSWARQTSLVTNAEINGQPEPHLPQQLDPELLDRSRLTPAQETVTMEEANKMAERLGDVIVVDPSDPVGLLEKFKEMFPPAFIPSSREDEEDDLRENYGGVWHFTLENLQALQKAGQPFSEKKISVVDSVMAFLWQRYYVSKYALGQHEDANEKANRGPLSSLAFAGDIRRRITPPLPVSYMGAALDVFQVKLDPQILVPDGKGEEAFGRSLGAACEAIRLGNESFREARYWELLRLAQATPIVTPILPQGPVDLVITDHTRNNVRDLDWGPDLGSPVEMREVYYNRPVPNYEVTLMSRMHNGDITVMITGERITMDRLVEDKIMNQFSYCEFTIYDFPQALKENKQKTRARL